MSQQSYSDAMASRAIQTRILINPEFQDQPRAADTVSPSSLTVSPSSLTLDEPKEAEEDSTALGEAADATKERAISQFLFEPVADAMAEGSSSAYGFVYTKIMEFAYSGSEVVESILPDIIGGAFSDAFPGITILFTSVKTPSAALDQCGMESCDSSPANSPNAPIGYGGDSNGVDTQDPTNVEPTLPPPTEPEQPQPVEPQPVDPQPEPPGDDCSEHPDSGICEIEDGDGDDDLVKRHNHRRRRVARHHRPAHHQPSRAAATARSPL